MKITVACITVTLMTVALAGCSKPSDSTPQSVKDADGYSSGYYAAKNVSLDFYRTNFPSAYQACQGFGEYQLAELAGRDVLPYYENWLTGCIDGLEDQGF